MIEKFTKDEIESAWVEPMAGNIQSIYGKINKLVDAVNKLETMAKNTNTVLESLVQENNIHEKQIDELQMKVEPKKCESRPVNVQDKFAEQRKWIGKLCRFWDDGYDSNYILLLKQIDDDDTPFVDDNDVCWEHCEPVKPDDDIIYKGGDNE